MPIMSGVKPRHRDILDDLRETDMAKSERISIQQQRQSLYCTIMKDAWRDAGESLSDPGHVRQWYYPDKQMLVIEFEDG